MSEYFAAAEHRGYLRGCEESKEIVNRACVVIDHMTDTVSTQSERIAKLEKWVEEFRRYLSNHDRARELQAAAVRILKK